MLVELERPEDGIAVLRLNNSPLNLVTLELTRQLDEALLEISSMGCRRSRSSCPSSSR